MNTPSPAALRNKSKHPDLTKANDPRATNAELRALVNSPNLDAAERAFERLRSRTLEYGN